MLHVLTRRLILIAPIAFLIVAGSVFMAQMNANVVGKSGLSLTNQAITPNQLKPPACAGVNVTQIVTGSGTFHVTTSNNLVLGSQVDDHIIVQAGNNCILAGGGNDTCSGS